ncbi:MAG: trypsin-like serine protease [Anaerolineales bacterium]
MRKALTTILIIALLLAPIIAAAPASASQLGQEGDSPDAPVSNIGGSMEMSASAPTDFEESYQGTGEKAPIADQVIPKKYLNLPTVEELAGVLSTESVLGADGRMRVNPNVFPYRSITWLVITFGSHGSGTCTGWFYGPRSVATAGHCLYQPGWGWATKVIVFPGKNGSSSPFGSTTAYRLFSVSEWVNKANPNFDYGVIQTRHALGNRTGWFGYWWQAANKFAGSYTVSGYPGDKPAGQQWRMPGALTHVLVASLWYKIDTFGGQSGSPIFIKRSGCGWCTAGIHAYGVPRSPYTIENSGTRIRQAVFNNLFSWKYAPYP